MKALSTSFHMLYCLSQNSKYFLIWQDDYLSVGTVPGTVPPPCFPVSIFEEP